MPDHTWSLGCRAPRGLQGGARTRTQAGRGAAGRGEGWVGGRGARQGSGSRGRQGAGTCRTSLWMLRQWACSAGPRQRGRVAWRGCCQPTTGADQLAPASCTQLLNPSMHTACMHGPCTCPLPIGPSHWAFPALAEHRATLRMCTCVCVCRAEHRSSSNNRSNSSCRGPSTRTGLGSGGSRGCCRRRRSCGCGSSSCAIRPLVRLGWLLLVLVRLIACARLVRPLDHHPAQLLGRQPQLQHQNSAKAGQYRTGQNNR